MRKSLLAASLMTVAIAVAGVAGIVFASASSGAAAARQHFTILSNNPNGNGWVASRGPIHALGKDIVLSAHKDRFKYPNGSLIIVHRRSGKPTQHFDKKSCLATFHEEGTYRIARATGAYKGTTGSGKYEASGKIIGCSPKKPPLVFQQEVEASGPLTR